MFMRSAYRIVFFVVLGALSAGTAFAQSFRVPEHYSFNTREDYHKYDKDIIHAINWIEKTTPGEEADRMKVASRFLLEWLSGCPYVRFTQNVRIDAFLGDSPQYRIYYEGGWVKYALEDKTEHPDKMMCTLAGIRAVLKVYKHDGNKKRDPNIDELAKLDQQGKLKDWVQERM